MSAIPDDRARSIAAAIDEYDDQIALLQAGKRETYQDLRAELEGMGLARERVKLELDALKAAISLRRKRAKDPETVDEKSDLTDAYLVALTNAPRATHAHRNDRANTHSPGASAPAEMPSPSKPPEAQDEGSAVQVGYASDDCAVGDRATTMYPRQSEEFVARDAGASKGGGSPAPARVDGWPERPADLTRTHSAAPAQAAE